MNRTVPKTRLIFERKHIFGQKNGKQIHHANAFYCRRFWLIRIDICCCRRRRCFVIVVEMLSIVRFFFCARVSRRRKRHARQLRKQPPPLLQHCFACLFFLEVC